MLSQARSEPLLRNPPPTLCTLCRALLAHRIPWTCSVAPLRPREATGALRRLRSEGWQLPRISCTCRTATSPRVRPGHAAWRVRHVRHAWKRR